MDQDLPLQKECKVSGVLCFVLYLTRILGFAPLQFKKDHGGWRISVSRICSFYGHTLILVLITSSILALVTDLTINKEHSFRTHGKANSLLWTTDIMLVDMVVLTGTYTGINRMRRVIDCTAQLKLINKELSRYHQTSPPNEKNLWFLVISMTLLGCFACVTDFAIFLIEVMNNNGNVLTSSLYLSHNLLGLVVNIFVLQFSVVITSVLPSLQTLNACLSDMYKELLPKLKPDMIDRSEKTNVYNRKTNKPFVRVIETQPAKTTGEKHSANATSATLRRLTSIYCSLCDIVRQLNWCNGFLLVLFFMSLLLRLINTLYHLITAFFTDLANLDHSNAPLQVILTIYQAAKLMMVVEPCHRTHEQISLTKTLVSRMRCYVSPDNFTVTTELKMFYRHIMLNEVSYSPMQLFTLNRNLVVAIMSTITTYLVVVIQL